MDKTDLMDLMDLMDPMVLMDLLAHLAMEKVHMAQDKVSVEIQVHKVSMEVKDGEEIKVHKVGVETKEIKTKDTTT